eukprot:COSAG04_NODE_2029_length_4968_cov_14.878004_7_plen_147_part_00
MPVPRPLREGPPPSRAPRPLPPLCSPPEDGAAARRRRHSEKEAGRTGEDEGEGGAHVPEEVHGIAGLLQSQGQHCVVSCGGFRGSGARVLRRRNGSCSSVSSAASIRESFRFIRQTLDLNQALKGGAGARTYAASETAIVRPERLA